MKNPIAANKPTKSRSRQKSGIARRATVRATVTEEKSGPEGVRTKYDGAFERVYRIVLRIPRGKVMTYGQISLQLNERFSPRFVVSTNLAAH